MLNDTIAAIATPIATSGIGIVRISGEDAFQIISNIFKSHKEKKSIVKQKSHTIHYGFIREKENVVDEVLVSIMKAPNTFTRENVVEINCHGGIVVMKKILNIVLDNGARLAEPGEFTKRAFLNGRIDLSQAEAVIDLINAKTDLSLKSSVNQLEGSIKNKIEPLRHKVLEIIAHLEASIDYPEYDIDEMEDDKLKEDLNVMIKALINLLNTADYGKILREGLKTIIIGKPNVGKSSLMNVLLREERAIVTDIPGTTRDTLEEFVNINGIPLNIIDTAGIRDTNDIIEKMGVEKSRNYIEQGDLIILVLDGSKDIDEEDKKIIDLVKNKETIVLINKSDLDLKLDVVALKAYINKPIINISAKKHEGIDAIEKAINELFFKGQIDFNDDIYITNIRHKNALSESIKSLEKAIESINMNMPEDCIVIDLKSGYEKLGEIVGDAMNDDIIDQIFSQFCLGK
ncbi:tRNA modification GTPase [Natranaerovirga hydrolytica]|uniref:tRNA modification GTPase MnmE n=1 Tax=Natranaerovirga hydrolytica TaxID=680378 RepID=A0A4R1M5C1_9FIRM|nr:tRNA uridine-5-carboxymethylaminomethyl(34) synthesis GTPase MnmE [Natranaerovirga hydrolytica]TCK86787.1 tRNA modification GTPase [Natranaerovirga hydrolytica]